MCRYLHVIIFLVKKKTIFLREIIPNLKKLIASIPNNEFGFAFVFENLKTILF